MKFLQRLLLSILFYSACFVQLSVAQNWESSGYVPGYALAYDQNNLKRTIVTAHNVYRSTDGGLTWDQKLTPANAPFLNLDIINFPGGEEGRFQQFMNNYCRVYDDILFLTAETDIDFSSSSWVMYHSIDGGNTLTPIFTDTDPYNSNTDYGYDTEFYQIDNDTYIVGFRSNSNGPSFSKMRFYVSTNKGQNWNFIYQYDGQVATFAGLSNNNYVFLEKDRLVFRDKNTGNLNSVINLPEESRAAAVDENDIRVLAYDYGSGELRGYQSSNGGSSFNNYSVTLPNGSLDNPQIFEDRIFISSGSFANSAESYRLSFSNFNNPVLVSDGPNYGNYSPYRITSDGKMANLLAGGGSHFPNHQSLGNGLFFNTPFEVSDNNWTSHSSVPIPPFTTTAIPSYNGQSLRFETGDAWISTDGNTWTKTFELAAGSSDVRYFNEATHVFSNSYYSAYSLTNDGINVVSEEPFVVGTNDALYAWRNDGSTSLGIFKSTDNGASWVFENDGWFYGNNARHVWADEVTGHFYSLLFTGSTNETLTYQLAKSTDFGLNWELLTTTDLMTTTRDDWSYNKYKPFVVYNNYLFMKNGSELHYSTDGGVSFQKANNLPFEMAGAKMYRLGDDLCVRTYGEAFYKININDWLGAAGGSAVSGKQTDLSLSVSMDPPNPPTWSNFNVTYTITNSSDLDATSIGINTFIASPVDAIVQGGTTPIYQNLSSTNITLAAGESGSITYQMFRKNGAMPQPWGELSSYREPDVDSRPNNGDYPDVNEDDEAILGGGPVCAITTTVFLGDCENNGTPSNASDDVYDADVAVTNPAGSGFTLFIPELNQTINGTYGTAPSFENLLIADGPITLNLTDNTDSNCTASTSISPPDPCSGSFGCEITATVANLICNDASTPNDPSDDRYAVRFDVQKDGPCGDFYRIDNFPNIGVYGAVGSTVGNFLISEGARTFIISDVDNPDYATTVLVTPPAPCSGGTPLPDLVPQNLTATATSVAAGNGIGVNFNAANIGGPLDASQLPFKAQLYLSTNNTLGNSDSPIGSQLTLGTGGAAVGGTIPANTAAGQYYLLVKVDDADEITESDEVNNVRATAQTITVTNGGGGGDIDLELSLSQPNASPGQWSNYTVTATLTNTGGQTATGVRVSFPKADGVVYTGGNEYTASQGSFSAFTNEEWNVGSIAAGSSATLEVSYFLLESTAPLSYAQVTAANQTDGDSTPGNGTCCTPNEDDEANSEGGVNPPPPPSNDPDLNLSNLSVTNSPLEAGSILSYNFTASNIGDDMATGNFTIKAWISTDNTLSNNDIQDGIIPTGNYSAGQIINNVPGASTIPAGLANGQYYLILKIDADDVIAENNENNNTVSKPFTVQTGTPPTGGDGVDLELTMTTSNPNPSVYSSVEITVEVSNTGTDPASGVKVALPRPDDVVYTGGNEWDATQGSFNPFGNEKWTVGDIPANGSASITVSYFLLTDNTLQAYAQVDAMNESDIDSSPNNGSCCTPTEDDEAVLSLNSFNGGGNQFFAVQELEGRSIQLTSIQPNPVNYGTTNAIIQSKEEGFYDLEIYDAFGRKMQSQKVALEKGENRITLNIADFKSGTYILHMPGENWRYMPVRFVVVTW